LGWITVFHGYYCTVKTALTAGPSYKSWHSSSLQDQDYSAASLPFLQFSLATGASHVSALSHSNIVIKLSHQHLGLTVDK
jgi:hypothetical protein